MLLAGRATLVMGAQFGDEGKGKLVDRLAEGADFVCRVQGGNNAGHTLVIGGKKIVTHAIPSGIVRPECQVVIGAGVVVDPFGLKAEIGELRAQGVTVEPARVSLDPRAALILPSHRASDKARESSLAGEAIGTTGRGIGPAYASRAFRDAPRIGDLVWDGMDVWRERSPHLFEGWESGTYEALLELGRELRPFVRDTVVLVNDALDHGRKVLVEGAQGALLDNLFGTYPYVTSSQMLAGAAGGGLGIAPWKLSQVVGVFKAYATRVGNGPFPAELSGPFAEELRTKGHEFGATTGRPRRVSWLDLLALKYMAKTNGFTVLAMTKGDVLAGMDHVGVVTGYRSRTTGEIMTSWPMRCEEWEDVEAILEFAPGWRNLQDPAFERFIRLVEEAVGVNVGYVSTGPGRDEGYIRNLC